LGSFKSYDHGIAGVSIIEWDSTVARQQKQIEALTAGLQKVSAQLEVSKSAPETVLNNQ